MSDSIRAQIRSLLSEVNVVLPDYTCMRDDVQE
jgi:hypothetical protein